MSYAVCFFSYQLPRKLPRKLPRMQSRQDVSPLLGVLFGLFLMLEKYLGLGETAPHATYTLLWQGCLVVLHICTSWGHKLCIRACISGDFVKSCCTKWSHRCGGATSWERCLN